jgi:hypothetical protein
MTIVRSYVVLATGNVKGCPLTIKKGEVNMGECKACSHHARLE